MYGTPTKKSRSNSIDKGSQSKSKKKTINLTQLDSSRKSSGSAKSKRSQKS
jgi:hypothetical protein